MALTVAATIQLQKDYLRAMALRGEMDQDPLLKELILSTTRPQAERRQIRKLARKILKSVERSRKT